MGKGLRIGHEGVPSWVAGISTGAWTEIADSPNFQTWADTALAPVSGNYRPNNAGAIGAMRDAYSQYAFDHTGKAAYVWGGGHSDGSCNAVVKFDCQTLEYSLKVAATPPSAYPPSYTTADAAITYPSGLAGGGFFKSTAQLTDPADTAYGAPFEARRSSHSYGSLTYYAGKMQTHYSYCGDADVAAGNWSYLNANPYGSQFLAQDANYGSDALSVRVTSLVDTTLGKVWATFHAGDISNYWRSHLIRIDPSTRTVEHYVAIPDLNGTESGCLNGRDLWLTCGTTVSTTTTANRAFRMDMDTRAVTHYSITGDLVSWTEGGQQEAAPSFHDGTYLYVWGFLSDKDALMRVDIANPTSGAGTLASPYVVTSTRQALSASGIGTVAFTYRLDYVPEWGVVMVLPRANAKWWALKI